MGGVIPSCACCVPLRCDMALVTTKAIVIRSRRWGEADRILTFFSLRLGKVRGIARGVRRMKSRFGGMLEPFSSINLTLFEKRHDDLASVSHVDVLDPFFSVRECLERISAASCMVALIDGIMADRDPSPAVFQSLLMGLRLLVRTDDPRLLTLMFQMRVLGQSGFRPQLDHCVTCGGTVRGWSFTFSTAAGGLLCAACHRGHWDCGVPMSPGSVAFLRQARRMPFEFVTRLTARGRVRNELEQMIDTYTRIVVGKRLPENNLLTVGHSAVAEDVVRGWHD